jgi:alpha-beta hydrolase superfamily lysophospholipase
MNISIHKIYATDGLELDAILFEPKKKTKSIIIHIHGKEGHFIQNHFVTTMGELYPKSGYSFLTFNNRGHDYLADIIRKSATGFEWVTKGTAHDRIEEAPHDINGVIAFAKKLGYKRIILQGHSLGPHKICYYLTNKPIHHVDEIILLSCADTLYLLDAHVPDWKKWVQTAKRMIKKGEGDELIDIRLWSNAPVSARTYLHYTRDSSNTWQFNYSNPKLKFKHFNKVKHPILAIFPSDDFSIGVKSSKALSMLSERTVSKSFHSAVIRDTIHNYASKEKELATRIISWLRHFE